MKANRLGILSALFASVCCVTPLVLVLLGLGSLGIGPVLGRFHWWFLGAALVLLTMAWRRYVEERRRCATERCELLNGAVTRRTLMVASLVVAVLVGLNVYTYAGRRIAPASSSASGVPANLSHVLIPVEGMTCLTCELTIESSLNRLPGVAHTDANVARQAVAVSYDPAHVTVEELTAAIRKTGYTVNRAPESEDGHGRD